MEVEELEELKLEVEEMEKDERVRRRRAIVDHTVALQRYNHGAVWHQHWHRIPPWHDVSLHMFKPLQHAHTHTRHIHIPTYTYAHTHTQQTGESAGKESSYADLSPSTNIFPPPLSNLSVSFSNVHPLEFTVCAIQLSVDIKTGPLVPHT